MSRAAEGPRRAVTKPSRRKARKEEKKRTPAQKVLLWFAEFFLYVVILLVVMSLVRAFLVQPFRVPSQSMEQTIQVGETIVVWKRGDLHRGAVVVFRDDQEWLPSSSSTPWWKEALAFIGLAPPQGEQYLVKRLIGLPGDHVTCCTDTGRIKVNGYELDETEYLNPSARGIASERLFDIIVPEGHIFVLGDNRKFSADSRAHMCSGGNPTPQDTFPTIESVQGHVFAISQPLSAMRTIKTPDSFDVIPESMGAPPGIESVAWACPLELNTTGV